MEMYRPERSMRTFLYRKGSLQTNLSPNPTPSEFLGQVQNVSAPVVSPTPVNPTPVWVHPDAGINTLSTYDELIIDLDIQITVSSIVTSLFNDNYRVLAESNRPFWLVIRTDGYGVTDFNSATGAEQTAKQVMSSMWNDVLFYHLQRNFKGFALLNCNLNVSFANGSFITREMQSRLILAGKEIGANAMMMLTTRPHDAVATIGPALIDNPSRNRALPYSILGQRNQVYPDMVVSLYPNVPATLPNVSTFLAQASAFLVSPVMQGDLSFVDYAAAFSFQPSWFAPDMQGGIQESVASPGGLSKMRKISNFLLALGITNIVLHDTSISSLTPVPPDWLSPTLLVNKTGKYSYRWSSNQVITVLYVTTDTDGNETLVERTFDNTYTETTPPPT